MRALDDVDGRLGPGPAGNRPAGNGPAGNGPAGNGGEGTDGRPPAGADRARGSRLVAVLAVAAAVVAVLALVPTAPRTSLGRIDGAALAEDVAPPGPLRGRVWRTPDLVTGRDEGSLPLARPGTPEAVAVRGGPVVALPGGEVTRPVAGSLPAHSGLEAELLADELLLRDAATGDLLRRRRLADEGERRPTELVGWVDNDLLAVDAGGRLVRLGNDGRVLWRAVDGVLPPPVGVVARGWLVVTATGAGRDHLVLDLRTGRPGAWSARVGALEQPRAVRPPDGPSLVLAVRDGVVTAWTLPSGRARWTARLGSGGDVVLHDDGRVLAALVLGDDGTSQVVRLDPATGAVDTRVTGPRVAPGSLGTGRWAADPRGVAVVTPEGARVTPWRRDTRLLLGAGTHEVALADGVVALGRTGPDGVTVAQLHDRGSGELLAEVPARAPSPLAPVAVVGQHVALATDPADTAVAGLRWLRLGDGTEVPATTALRGRLDGADLDGLHLLGTVDGDLPVLLRTDGAGPRLLAAGAADDVPLPRWVGLRDGSGTRAVGVGADRLVLAGRGGGAVVDLDALRGDAEEPAASSVTAGFVPLAVVGDGALAVAPGGRLAALRLDDGDAADGTIAADVVGDAVQAGEVARVAATAVAAGGTVVATTDARTLVGIDPATAAVLWTRPLEGRVVAPLVPWGGLVAVVTDDGRVAVHDVRDGEPTWTHTVAGDAPTTAAAAGPRLVLGTVTGTLQVLDQLGRVVDEHDVGSGPVSAAVVVDGRVLATVGSSAVAVGGVEG